MAWVVLRRRAIQRTPIGSQQPATFSFEREPGLPEFQTRLAAIRAITELMCGLPPGSSDECIRAHWGRYRSNVGHHKVERATNSVSASA